MKWIFLVCVLSAVLLSIATFTKYSQDIFSFLKIPSSYYAKEFCSCRFVMNQSDEFCHRWASVFIPPSKLQADEKNKYVFSEVFFHKAEARYLGPFVGCSLR